MHPFTASGALLETCLKLSFSSWCLKSRSCISGHRELPAAERLLNSSQNIINFPLPQFASSNLTCRPKLTRVASESMIIRLVFWPCQFKFSQHSSQEATHTLMKSFMRQGRNITVTGLSIWKSLSDTLGKSEYPWISLYRFRRLG